MPLHLLINPPATGKSQICIDLVKSAVQNNPFSVIWYLVPDQIQADYTRARFSATGQTLTVRVATFQDLYVEILERIGQSLPVAGASMRHHLLQEVIHDLNETGQITHFAPICNLPGFQKETQNRIAELKRARVEPKYLFEIAENQSDSGLIDLAKIYGAYQTKLQNLGWTDTAGLSEYALKALSSDAKALTDISLLIVDGFDNFDNSQLSVLKFVTERTAESWITLPGTPEMARQSHHRFSMAAKNLVSGKSIDIQSLNESPHLPPTLRKVEKNLFETSAQPIQSGDDLQRIETRSPMEEAREALRWIKGRIVRDNLQPSDCAIAVPDIESYRASLEAASDEFGVPIRFSQGQILSAIPAGAAILDLLNLTYQDYPLRSLLDTIRSPYFALNSLGLHLSDAKLLEIASRYGQVVQGLAQWEETLTALSKQNSNKVELVDLSEEGTAIPELPSGKIASRLLGGLQSLSDRLSPPGEMSFKQWAIWLQDLLESIGFFKYLAEAGEIDVCDTFDSLLLALVHSEALTGESPTGYEGFLKEWAGLMRTTALQEELSSKSQPAVRIYSLMEARGIRVDALAVLGLAEGIFPSIERADPFLSEDIRKQLDMEPKIGQEQAGLFYQVVTRADRFLLLTRPYLAKDGESWEPSPYWNALQELLLDKPMRIHPDEARSLSEAASPNELLFWNARRWSQTGAELKVTISDKFESRWHHIVGTQTILADRLQKDSRGVFDGDLSQLSQLLSVRYGEQAGWSASRLESYASCPFSFLVSSGLGLEVIEPPQIGYQANQLGTILHAVLEQVYPEVSDPSDSASVLSHLPEVARRVFETAPRDYKFRPSPLWETQKTELFQVLEAAVQGIADYDPSQKWRPLAFEAKFGMGGKPPLVLDTPGGGIRLHGLIDRIDINPEGKLRVIDYKSGGSQLSPQDLIEGRRLQLPIYALAASQALGLGEPVEGFYWKLFQQGASALKLSQFESDLGNGPEAAFTVATNHIEDSVIHIREGLFQPNPPQYGCPSYCVAASWCWHYKVVRY